MCWCTAFVVLCECIALAFMVRIVAVWNVRCRKKKKVSIPVFSFVFQIQPSSMLTQWTFAWRVACRHILAEETLVTEGYIPNATLVWQEHELSRELSTALYVTVWCDQPLARRAALNASAQVQIYLEDSQDLVFFARFQCTLQRACCGVQCCLPASCLCPVAVASLVTMLVMILVHLGVFYKNWVMKHYCM